MSEQQDGQPEGAEVHADRERVALANDLARRFSFHPADTSSRRMAHEETRALCHTLASRLADLVPPGRERSLAFTACEEAMFWANAGIARLYPTADEQEWSTARPRTARELGLSGRQQQAEPHPVPGGTQNPATLVETEDMPAPEQPERGAETWEATPEGGAGQPDTATSDPDTEASP